MLGGHGPRPQMPGSRMDQDREIQPNSAGSDSNRLFFFLHWLIVGEETESTASSTVHKPMQLLGKFFQVVAHVHTRPRTLLLASGDPNQRKAGKLEGSSVRPSTSQHDSATSAGTSCTNLTSSLPIGTAWLRFGEHCTQGAHASRRQRTRQARERNSIQTSNQSVGPPWGNDTRTRAHTLVLCSMLALALILTLEPTNIIQERVVNSPIDPGCHTPPLQPTPTPSPSHISIYPLCPVVPFPSL